MAAHPKRAGAPGAATLGEVARAWTRIGCVGFGGPPAHIALLRAECVERRRWLSPEDFEDAIAATNLLPGPGSTQLAIFCAWRVAGVPGAVVGGAGFILPGLAVILLLAGVFLAGAPPAWVRGAGAGAGAAVAAVALRAGGACSSRAGAARAASAGGCAGPPTSPPGSPPRRRSGRRSSSCCSPAASPSSSMRGARPGPGPALAVHAWPALFVAAAAAGGLGALAWVALKVGALSYGGGFVIIPLMQADATERYGWMTDAEFLNAVALGQVTPGPVVHTVAVVGYAAAGVGGGLLAAAVAFAPSFTFVLLGAERFDRLRASARVRAFLDGAGPAAIGAIVGSAIPLARALGEPWQLAVLAAAALALLVLRWSVVAVLVGAGALGAALGLAGVPLPRS